MSYFRPPILNSEQLSIVKERLTPLWNARLRTLSDNVIWTYDAKEIAHKLKFGEPGSPFEKLKPYHVYKYRKQLGLRARKTTTVHTIKQGEITRRSRYRVLPEEINHISPQEFIERLREVYPLEESLDTFRLNLMKSAYCVIQYYSPLRKSEIYERTLGDLEIRKEDDETILRIHLERKKKLAKNRMYLPYDIPIDFPGMDVVLRWIERRKEQARGNHDARVFTLNGWSSWWAFKRVYEDWYPHYTRFDHITKTLSSPGGSIQDVRDDTGLTLAAIEKYARPGGDVALAKSRRRRRERYQKEENKHS